MEADWEFEVSPDAAGDAAPVIEAAWSGFVDLRHNPDLAWNLPEAAQLPGLAEALIRLNEAASSFLTSKCDVWPILEVGDVDPDELDAPSGSSAHAMGCYIDLLPRGNRQWLQPETAAIECKGLCLFLHTVPLPCCRADLAIRRAFIHPNALGKEPAVLGVTAYLTSCGASQAAAEQTLQAALAALVDALRGTRS